MAKLRIKAAFQDRLSEKLMDLGNLFAAALVIGQFVSGKEFSFMIFVAGLIGMSSCYVASYILSF